MKERNLQLFAWGVSLAALAVAIIAWGQGIRWKFSDLSTYQIFPVFGLAAFSLMWSHYIASVTRQYFALDKAVLRAYFEATSLAVLIAILIHPGLLTWQLWRDGLGLPPGSELNYVQSSLRWAVLLGMTALLVFVAYEFRRKFGGRKWWKYVQYATDAAMLMIFIHALNLGGQLQSGWFRGVWYFYGVTLIGSLAYTYYKKLTLVKN
jgi:hypothetical protein